MGTVRPNPRLNEAPPEAGGFEISPADYEELRRENEVDQALYDRAQRLLAAEIATHGD